MVKNVLVVTKVNSDRILLLLEDYVFVRKDIMTMELLNARFAETGDHQKSGRHKVYV